MGHVDGIGVTPFRDDIAVTKNESVRRRMRFERPDGIGIGPGELQRNDDTQIARIDGFGARRIPGFAGDGKVDGGLQLRRIQPLRRGRTHLPSTFGWKVIGGPRQWSGGECYPDEKNTKKGLHFFPAASVAAIFSAIITVVRCVLARTTDGITEASTTHRPSKPRTRQRLSTTLRESLGAPMRQVDVPCCVSPALAC